jgi:TorA maturation chaperone TorD
MTQLDDTEQNRANLYKLLAVTLARPPEAKTLAALATLDGEGEIGTALHAVAAIARTATPATAQTEYDALFLGMVSGEVIPYASFYLTGFLYERPLARLRADMAELGFSLVDGRSDPEDHIATILEVMAPLIEADLATQQKFFSRHIEPWAVRFFTDLEAAPSAHLYRPLAALGKTFLALERQAFLMEYT